MIRHSDKPSVTEVLSLVQDFADIPKGILERAAKRGTAAHLACELLDRGLLDEDLLEHEVKPYLDAWRGFIYAYEPEFIDIEKPFSVVCESPYNYQYYSRGLDRTAKIAGEIWLLDIKTVSQISAHSKKVYACQLGGYCGGVDYDLDKAGIVHLRKDGTFKLYDLSGMVWNSGIYMFHDLLRAWYALRAFHQWKHQSK